MPINVLGNSSSSNSSDKIDTSLVVQKPYLGTNYIESIFEEDIALNNQYKSKNLTDPNNVKEDCNKSYVDNIFIDPSILKNTAPIDLNGRNITNADLFRSINYPRLSLI